MEKKKREEKTDDKQETKEVCGGDGIYTNILPITGLWV